MMSDRERWIVYPLLFLAIGFGFKSQWPQPSDLECRSIRCNEVIVDALDGGPRVRIGSTPSQSGEIRVFGSTGQIAMVLGTDDGGKRGVVQTLGDQRNHRVVMGSDTAGGFVRLHGEPNIPSLFLGHDGRLGILGLLALNEQDKPLVLSHNDRSVLWGLQVPLPRNQAPDGQTEPSTESDQDAETAEDEPAPNEGQPADETAAKADEVSDIQQPAEAVEETAETRPSEGPASETSEDADASADEGDEQREAGEESAESEAVEPPGNVN